MKTCLECVYLRKRIKLSKGDAITCGFEKLRDGLSACEKFKERKR